MAGSNGRFSNFCIAKSFQSNGRQLDKQVNYPIRAHNCTASDFRIRRACCADNFRVAVTRGAILTSQKPAYGSPSSPWFNFRIARDTTKECLRAAQQRLVQRRSQLN